MNWELGLFGAKSGNTLLGFKEVYGAMEVTIHI